ncbi:MAG: flavin reductase family protein [Alphaproteobacteria bacterium]|nr:flavin reductase family protein [Alphaproteobacteria bacterium]
MDSDDEVTSTVFRTVCGRFATGVAVATTRDGKGARWGLTVNSFSSVSLDPPLVLFSIDRSASSHDIFLGSPRFGINILSDRQKALSDRFSFLKDEDRFDGIDLVSGREADPPLIDGAIAHIVCDLANTFPGGDHTILLGRVRHTAVSKDTTARPLLYYAGGYAGIS